MRQGAVVVVLLTLLTPLAVAAEVTGSLRVDDGFVLPGDAQVRGVPLALFMPAVDSGTRMEGDLASVTVLVFENRYVTTNLLGQRPVVATQSDRPTWTLHDVRLHITPARGGWMGLSPAGGLLEESSKTALRIALEADAHVGNGRTPPEGSDAAMPFYAYRATAWALTREVSAWSYAGAGALKIMGPTVTLVARENTTRIETGEMPDPDNPVQTLRRHVVLEFTAAEVRATGRSEVVSTSLEATGDGVIELHHAAGTLAGDVREWRATGGPARLDGAFSIHATADDALEAIHLALAGDLRDSTFDSTASIRVPGGRLPPWVLILGACIVAVGATTVVGLHRRERMRSRNGRLHADELTSLAERAADAEDYARAATLASQARALVPTSRRLALDHAYYLAKSDRRREAMRVLEERILEDEADAFLLLATLRLEAGQDAQAAASLVRALELAPSTVLDVETDPALGRLVDRPDVALALREARRRLG